MSETSLGDGFVTVCDEAKVPVGGATRVVVGDEEIALFNVDGDLYATGDICSHEEASLSEGETFGHVVECPLHGARFDVRTGKALSLPAVYPVRTYEVRVVEGRIALRV